MTKIGYAGYRFPPVIIQQAVWLYARFTLSFRDVEDLLAERGIMVSYETVRRCVKHFGPMIGAPVRLAKGPDWALLHFDETSRHVRTAQFHQVVVAVIHNVNHQGFHLFVVNPIRPVQVFQFGVAKTMLCHGLCQTLSERRIVL